MVMSDEQTIATAALAGVRFKEMQSKEWTYWWVTLPDGGHFIASTMFTGAKTALKMLETA